MSTLQQAITLACDIPENMEPGLSDGTMVHLDQDAFVRHFEQVTLGKIMEHAESYI